MKVVSTNIGQPEEMIINGKKKVTGIFKRSVESIHLEKSDVQGDSVMNRKHHGGPEKAVYVFSADQYPFWKSKYPDLHWEWGMFGENISIEGWDESEVQIGDIYNIGLAQVQVSQPRIPCNFLSTKFKDQTMLGAFVNYTSPGTYLRVLKEGEVKPGDILELASREENSCSVVSIYELLAPQKKDRAKFKEIMQIDSLSDEFKKSISKRYI